MGSSNNIKKWCKYFFEKDRSFENAYIKLTRFSVLQVFLTLIGIAIVSWRFSGTSPGGWEDFTALGFYAGIIFLVGIVNLLVIRNYQNCCSSPEQDKGERLLFWDICLSLSTVPFFIFTKLFWLWKHYQSKSKE